MPMVGCPCVAGHRSFHWEKPQADLDRHHQYRIGRPDLRLHHLDRGQAGAGPGSQRFSRGLHRRHRHCRDQRPHHWLLGVLGLNIGGGLLGALTHLVVAALVLILSTAFVPGLKVKGVLGALVAAIAIGAMSWVVSALLSAIRIG